VNLSRKISFARDSFECFRVFDHDQISDRAGAVAPSIIGYRPPLYAPGTRLRSAGSSRSRSSTNGRPSAPLIHFGSSEAGSPAAKR
jgi:hypothetical protein